MPTPVRILALTAHPDDEITLCGAAFLDLKETYADRVETAIACATKGENYARPGWAPAVREEELHAAARVLGVDRVRFLGFRNGEMIQMLGPIHGRVVRHEREIPINTNWFDGLQPGHRWADHVAAVRALGALAFGVPPAVEGYDWRNGPLAPLVEAAVRAIRAERPDVVVTMEPFGNYGHNEHIMVHHAATVACYLSGRDEVWPEHGKAGLEPHAPHKLYWGGLYEGRPDRAARVQNAIAQARYEMGVPVYEPSLTLSAPHLAEQVFEALSAHRSQFALPSWAELPAGQRQFLGTNAFLRVYPPLSPGEPPEGSIVDGTPLRA
ncbi:MAG: PIG-L family deacetylase [Anaerolineae bacterium]|nr:PIG-L family deacetylase [Anaerolineae bacterium]